LSELTDKRRSLIKFDDRATRIGLEDEHSQRGIKCRTDVIASYLDRHEWVADQVLLGLCITARIYPGFPRMNAELDVDDSDFRRC
jgi:hypothetical protein